MRKLWFFLALLFFLSSLAMYLNQDSDMALKLRLAESSFMDNISIAQRNEGMLRWTLMARKAVFVDDNNIMLQGLTMTFPEKELVLTAEGGQYDIDEKDMQIKGNIKASTKDFNIVAKQLYWDSAKKELLSDDKVVILGKGFSVEGRGLAATGEKAVLSGNVKAVFNDK